MKVTVKKDGSIKRVKANRERHLKDFEKQILAWKIKMEEHNKKMSVWFNGSPDTERPIEPQKPFNHVEEYDRIIFMLDVHHYELIELSETDFDQIFRDKFFWSSSYINATNIASGTISNAEIKG